MTSAYDTEVFRSVEPDKLLRMARRPFGRRHESSDLGASETSPWASLVMRHFSTCDSAKQNWLLRMARRPFGRRHASSDGPIHKRPMFRQALVIGPSLDAWARVARAMRSSAAWEPGRVAAGAVRARP